MMARGIEHDVNRISEGGRGNTDQLRLDISSLANLLRLKQREYSQPQVCRIENANKKPR
jgi:hypothetical protein